MLTLTFISYFLYNEVTKHFEIPLCNYLINAVTVKETKTTRLHVHNEPLILFLHGHVVITDWGCVYACVCVREEAFFEEQRVREAGKASWKRISLPWQPGCSGFRAFCHPALYWQSLASPALLSCLFCTGERASDQYCCFHNPQSHIHQYNWALNGVCGIVDVLVGGCFAWFYSNIKCLCCAYSSLSFFGGVIKYVGCSQRMDWDQILSC